MIEPTSVYARAGLGRAVLRPILATMLAVAVALVLAVGLASSTAAASAAAPSAAPTATRAATSAAHHASRALLGGTYRTSSQRLSSFATQVAPTVHGHPRPGHRLTVVPAVVQPTPVAARFQWLRDGHPIAGATRRVHHLSPADAGHRISVRVTYSKHGYEPLAVLIGRLHVQRSAPSGSHRT